MSMAAFEQISALLDEPRSRVDELADEVIVSTSTNERLAVLLKEVARLSYSDGYKLFKRVWPECDDESGQNDQVIDFLVQFWNEHSPLDFLTEQETVWMASLPNRFKVYRGCDVTEVSGLRWTCCRSLATRDAKAHFDHLRRNPVAVSGTIKKQQVLMATATTERFEILAEFADLKEIRLHPLTIADW